MLNHVALRPHDQVRFGLIEGRWDVIDETCDGRYVLVTHWSSDTYQVIDREQGFRGALTGGPLAGGYPSGAPLFDTENREEDARRILDALEGGQELGLPSLMPLWIDQHWTGQIRGPVLDLDKLSDWAGHRVWHWLQANGCRWRVGTSAFVRIKGNYIHIDTWTIRNHRQARTLWPKRLGDHWEPPQKRRRFRIRVPLSTIRKA